MIAVNTWRGIELRPHPGGECHKCDGAGVDVYGCECEACDGRGDVMWDWYPGDGTLCSECGAEGVETMGTGEDREDGEVCLACYLAWHARECGCGLWPKEVTP